eukprot:IDg6960t1
MTSETHLQLYSSGQGSCGGSAENPEFSNPTQQTNATMGTCNTVLSHGPSSQTIQYLPI